jgi:hypothetical protein
MYNNKPNGSEIINTKVDAGIEVLILKILTYKKYSVNNTSTPSRMYDRLWTPFKKRGKVSQQTSWYLQTVAVAPMFPDPFACRYPTDALLFLGLPSHQLPRGTPVYKSFLSIKPYSAQSTSKMES